MEVTFGWWAIPLMITCVSLTWALITPAEHSGGYGIDILPLFRAAAAIIVSLASWLIWSLAT